MTKYIFITGGVVSSLGKGIAAASLAAILESRGLKVTLLKLDPYITVDNQNNVYFIGEWLGTGANTINPGNGAYYDNNWNYNDDSYILKIAKPCDNNMNPTSIQTDSNNICINSNGSITLTAIGGVGDTLRWYSGSCGQNYIGKDTVITIPSPNQTTTYYARWVSNCDTSACASITIIVKACEDTLFIPNIFTPNGDNINDYFFIKNASDWIINVQIFNRWGNLVYKADNYQNNWDGKYKGNPLSDGVYYYIINAKGKYSGKEEQYHGSLTILR